MAVRPQICEACSIKDLTFCSALHGDEHDQLRQLLTHAHYDPHTTIFHEAEDAGSATEPPVRSCTSPLSPLGVASTAASLPPSTAAADGDLAMLDAPARGALPAAWDSARRSRAVSLVALG